jgi:hypothetical protein
MNCVVVVPFVGEIEQEPFAGDGLIAKFIALTLLRDGENE